MNTEKYWTERYESAQTGWDIGHVSTPIKSYFEQVEDKNLSILIPGAGRAYEAEYLHNAGFANVYVLDISALPLQAIKKRIPDFPKENLIQGDFFEHEGSYDIIVEQTFFCSFSPTKENRRTYAQKMHKLLKSGGKLVGLWFSFAAYGEPDSPPYGGSREEYLTYFEPNFRVKSFEPCYNSISPRMGKELFGIFVK